jgi:hypothetical protein
MDHDSGVSSEVGAFCPFQWSSGECVERGLAGGKLLHYPSGKTAIGSRERSRSLASPEYGYCSTKIRISHVAYEILEKVVSKRQSILQIVNPKTQI